MSIIWHRVIRCEMLLIGGFERVIDYKCAQLLHGATMISLYWNQIWRAQCRQFAIFNGIVVFDVILNDRVTLINVQFMIYHVHYAFIKQICISVSVRYAGIKLIALPHILSSTEIRVERARAKIDREKRERDDSPLPRKGIYSVSIILLGCCERKWRIDVYGIPRPTRRSISI